MVSRLTRLPCLVSVILGLILVSGCGKNAPSGPTGDGKKPAPETEQVKWSFLTLSGKKPIETAVLPLLNFGKYHPIIPAPPQTAQDYDERVAYRDTAAKMVEGKNLSFLKALQDATASLEASKSWQENYELFLEKGRQQGSFLEQLENARASGVVCPGADCDPSSPAHPEGCPHTHEGRAHWAPDGSFMGLQFNRMGDTSELGYDSRVIDFDCGHKAGRRK